MNDRELIQALRCCVSSPHRDGCRNTCVFYNGDINCCIPEMGKAVADRLEALLAENEHLREVTKMMPKWVSVEERLPADETRVLALGADHVIHDMRWDKRAKEWRERATGAAYFDYFVTHWQPLPEPPSTEGVE